MFRDTQKELARLEAELLAQEPETPEEDRPAHGPALTARDYEAYNSDISDEELEEYVQTVRDGGKGRLSVVLAVLLCLLTAGLVALALLALKQEGIL